MKSVKKPLAKRALTKFKTFVHDLMDRKDVKDAWCSPPEVAEMIKDIIKDKIVCDLGCRKGFFMKDLQKYASQVIGIEKKKHLCKMARQKGFKVIEADYEEIELPVVDVYYIWAPEKRMERVLAQLRTQNKKGKLVKVYENEKGFEIKIIDI